MGRPDRQVGHQSADQTPTYAVEAAGRAGAGEGDSGDWERVGGVCEEVKMTLTETIGCY